MSNGLKRFNGFLLSRAALVLVSVSPSLAAVVAVVDGTSYNAGSTVRLRISGSAKGVATVRYAGESTLVGPNVTVTGDDRYNPLWTIPRNARTGRYEVDIDGTRNATSFAVHRKLARIERVELDRTFYTNGDPVRCRVTVRNLSAGPLSKLRVEFAPFHYPWIAPAPDEPKIHPSVIAAELTLAPDSARELDDQQVAIARGGDQPAVTGYAVVIWDEKREHVLDLAFTEPIFLRPPNLDYPKRYPFLYLYPSLRDVTERSLVYRSFYPPENISAAIRFDTGHTMFASGQDAAVKFSITPPSDQDWSGVKLRARVLDAAGKIVREVPERAARTGEDVMNTGTLAGGRYTFELRAVTLNGAVVASNRLELAFNSLPKSILIFGAHQDDDTAHPALIRAAVENNIPIRFVYLTSGDAGGCDRFYSRSCDAARAMNFGETRMAETRASLGHLGVKPEDIYFLGLPDGGLEEIWLNHVEPANPYLSVLLASDHAPYKDVVQPNLPFARTSVLRVVEQFIRKYQPEVIVAGHPEERHVDHRTNGWLVIKAMQNLLRDGAIPRSTRLLVDQSYGETSWIHSPYRYDKHEFHASGEVARLAQEALWFYQSQDGNHQQGAMLPFEKLPRTEAYPHLWIVDWDKHEGWNEHPLTKER